MRGTHMIKLVASKNLKHLVLKNRNNGKLEEKKGQTEQNRY